MLEHNPQPGDSGCGLDERNINVMVRNTDVTALAVGVSALNGRKMPSKAQLDSSHHRQRLKRGLKDPKFRAEYERVREEIRQIDEVMRQLDDLREASGLSKADLAREVGKHPAAIRRLFTAEANPELKTVAAIANALGAEIRVIPQVKKTRPRRSALS